jgi:hypothetical protein
MRSDPAASWLLSSYVVVELATAYLNPLPLLNTHANQLSDLFTRPAANPDPVPASRNTGKPWALNRRLSDEVKRAIVTAYQEGARQQVLADRYGVSRSSIKRLLRTSRLTSLSSGVASVNLLKFRGSAD